MIRKGQQAPLSQYCLCSTVLDQSVRHGEAAYLLHLLDEEAAKSVMYLDDVVFVQCPVPAASSRVSSWQLRYSLAYAPTRSSSSVEGHALSTFKDHIGMCFVCIQFEFGVALRPVAPLHPTARLLDQRFREEQENTGAGPSGQ